MMKKNKWLTDSQQQQIDRYMSKKKWEKMHFNLQMLKGVAFVDVECKNLMQSTFDLSRKY